MRVRIARFTTGEEPLYGVVTGEIDEYGQPDPETTIVALAGDPLYVGIKLLAEEHKLADVRLLAPVLPRSKVVGIGRNYADHAAEMGNDVPTEPMMFIKPNTSVVGPGDPIFYPPQTSEPALRGRAGRGDRPDLPRRAGRAGHRRDPSATRSPTTSPPATCSASDGQFTRAKGFDSFCPLGPWIETDLDPQTFADGVSLQTHLNGDLVQDGSTKDLIFDIPTLVAHVSSVMTLLPGDVILTGTPAGVGPMQVGDEIEVSIAGIGTLTNKVATR